MIYTICWKDPEVLCKLWAWFSLLSHYLSPVKECDKPAKPAVRLCDGTAVIQGVWKQQKVWCSRSWCPFLRRKGLLHPILEMCLDRLLDLTAFVCMYIWDNRWEVQKKLWKRTGKVVYFSDLLILLCWFSREHCWQWHLQLWTEGGAWPWDKDIHLLLKVVSWLSFPSSDLQQRNIVSSEYL